MSDLLTRLRANSAARMPMWALMEEATAEIERLQAIVGRLPKTADGVPIAPGDVVWLIGSHCDPFQVTILNEIVIRYPDKETSSHYPSWCYSTRKAAEQARAGK
jgi:hypothetical protein